VLQCDHSEIDPRADRKACRRVSLPFAFEERPLPLGASIGMAVFPDDGTEIRSLLETADQSMYAVKRTRKGHR
jgi:GGDEF domain-containing protein